MQSPSSDCASLPGAELAPPSSGSTRSSRSEHRSPHSPTRLGLAAHSRGASTSTATTRSDGSSCDNPQDRGTASALSVTSRSSTSTTSGRPSLPPPPAPLPAAYSHPSIPATPRRKPLPAPPATSPRFVPLHAPPSFAPSTASTSAQGDARRVEYVPTAAEEKAAARARAQGLDELLPLSSSPAVRAGKGVGERDDDSLVSPTSPTGTDLPDYPASPARGALRRNGTTAKRVVERDDEEARGGEDKRALAVSEVRVHVNDEARRTVEEDAATSKAALARRAEQEEREREDGERRRREREVEKGKGALEHDDELDEDDDEPPPPISPDEHGRGMLPLVDRKDLSSLDDDLASAPPPPLAASYRLPPPPVPLPEPAYPLSRPPDHRLAAPTYDDYFSHPPTSRPSFVAAHSAPLPTPHARPDPVRYATLASSTRSELYPGAVASSSSSSARSLSPAHGPVGPAAGARHGSLGPAHRFYSSGVGQITLKSLEERHLAIPASPAATFGSSSSTSHEHAGAAAGQHRRPSWAGSSGATAPVSSSSARAHASTTQPYLGRSMTASSSMSASSGVSYPGGSTSFASSAPDGPFLSSSSEVDHRVTAPPSPLPHVAHQPYIPSSSQAPVSSPAFYTSLHPGGPLLPFYAAPSTAPGQPPSSYFSPAGAQALPPPPTPPVFASLGPSPFAQTAAHPFQDAATSYGPPARSSSAGSSAPVPGEATSPRPWSRSSSAAGSSAHSPPPVERGPAGAGGAGGGLAVREKRMSTIRSLFGRRKGAGGGAGAGELAGTPEEEDEEARVAAHGWR
ncbi:hypothetical protein JCM3775_004757 [Rhodotorula graminis]